MTIEPATRVPFLVKDCVFATLATGERASRLKEFRDKLLNIDLGCVYYHFWGGRLTHFANPDYLNDFSIWAHEGLHDQILAERLNILDPTDYEDLANLRQDIIEIVEERLDEQEVELVCSKEHQFYFIRSNTIVFETSRRLYHPNEFIHQIPLFSIQSIFYHFIEARRRQPKSIDDFSHWLESFGEEYRDLINQLKEIDPYFFTLTELKEELTLLFSSYFGSSQKP